MARPVRVVPFTLLCLAYAAAGACTRSSSSAQGELDPSVLDTLNATPIAERAISPRATAVERFRTGRGEIRLTRTQQTVEGDPVRQWVLVRDGSARWIHDSRADRFRGQGPPVVQCDLKALRLVAIVEPGRTVEIAAADSLQFHDNPVVVSARAECAGEEPFEIHF